MRPGLGLLMLLGAIGCGGDGFREGTEGESESEAEAEAEGACDPEVDADGDGLADADEGDADTDGDGTPDSEDLDSDQDGILDSVEAGPQGACGNPADSDGDGNPDFRDLDSDENGIDDEDETASDTDGDGTGDFADRDNDGDTLDDADEIGDDPSAPRDTDEDDTPDYMDMDSDGDTIADADELDSDQDGDDVPSYRDIDSDGDTVPDAEEAGDDDESTPPVDTDGDGFPNYLDLDSDADGLADEEEWAAGSDPADADSDDDGATDLVESVAETDPNDPDDNPSASGDFFFLEPYLDDPSPPSDILLFQTDIVRADVLFLVDTTGSMDGEIDTLTSTLETVVVPGLAAEVPDVGLGVARYEDFPTSPYGGSSDTPFALLHRIMTVNTAAGLTSVSDAVADLAPASGGGDGPEAVYEALYQAATGEGTTSGGASVDPFDPATADPSSPPAGEEIGDLPGAGFRDGAFPIVVLAGDAISHNLGVSPYGFLGANYSPVAIAALGDIGAKVVGIASEGGSGDVDAEFDFIAESTDAVVDPAAFGGACGAGMCCTGLSGAGEAPNDDGLCPLVYTIDEDGGGLGDTVVDSITQLIDYAVIDISANPVDDLSDAVDSVEAFIDEIVPVTEAVGDCTPDLTVMDGVFIDVEPGTPVCFEVIVKMNTTVEPGPDPQLFRATIEVIGDGVTVLDSRDVYFVVPGVGGGPG